MSVDGVLNGLLKLVLPVAIVAIVALATNAVLDRMTRDQRAAERRALLQRNAELNLSAIAPGSVLSCLDGGAGEVIETACEKAVFASPESAASAIAYTGARLALLVDAQAFGEPAVADAFVAARRAIELDRYGIAAHVLATRDGCTAERCAAFALLRDATALKANLKAQAFDAYVGRYAAPWSKTQSVAEKQPQAPVAAPAPVASAPEQQSEPTGRAVSSKYDFPSAASIPAVSIMNAEPALPKAATEAQAAQPGDVPVPPKRPQAQAATPPAQPQVR